jgi:RNA polymerase sigma factor (TIGR02999 family)
MGMKPDAQSASKLPANADPQSLTNLLDSWRAGDGNAYDAIIATSYDALRRLAHQRLNKVGGFVGLSATDLLHEALIKVADSPKDWQSRAHFFASMSLTLRSVLVDFAREQLADKRGGEYIAVTFTESHLADNANSQTTSPTSHSELLQLDEELHELEMMDARAAEVLHLTYFASLTRDEIATVMKISVPTVDRELRFARGWLKTKLQKKYDTLNQKHHENDPF